MPVTSYSRTPSDNSSSPPNGWPEGQSAASVNNCARQLMTDVVNEAGKGQAKVLASVAGTNTITASMTPDLDAYVAGMTVVFNPAVTNTAGVTINIDSLGALDIFRYGGDALQPGDLVAGTPAYLILDSGADDFYLLNPQNVGFRNLPLITTGGSRTCIITDAGKVIYMTGAAPVATIPANASVAYDIGTAITFVANQSSGTATIAITSDTLVLAGTAGATTGTRTLAVLGIATAVKFTATQWLISGTGLS